MNPSRSAMLVIAFALISCRAGEHPSMAPAAASQPPTAAEVARALAQDPAFVQAVASQVVMLGGAAPGAAPPTAMGTPSVPVSETVAIDAAGSLSIGSHPMTDEHFATMMRIRLTMTPDLRVVVAADQHVPHERVVQVLGLLRRVGVTRFAMAVAPP